MKITQITTINWIGKNGDRMEDIIGLGDDNNIYKWHKGTGRWVLNIING